ncbi:MAG: ferrous iron transport protein A [Erysipelotrichaceae bacterium]|jgi:ferrous iron transport protein A|nr:ferrous iron transport protein A [Erysipelotrichaceae bacterium]
MKTLNEIQPGNEVIVKKLHGESACKKKLMDMGITKNTYIYVRKAAPLGDPVEIKVRGYELSIRKEDAACIEVERTTV